MAERAGDDDSNGVCAMLLLQHPIPGSARADDVGHSPARTRRQLARRRGACKAALVTERQRAIDRRSNFCQEAGPGPDLQCATGGREMASIRREVRLTADPSVIWDALKDVGAVHTRLARGFVVGTDLDGGDRVVTFANGLEVRERIVTVDEVRRRLVYAAVGGRMTHHNASFEITEARDGQCVLVWVADLLPDEMAGPIASMMDAGLEAIRRTAESSGTAGSER